MQLSLFDNLEISWNEITTEWLFRYLTNNFPELNFKLGNKWSYNNPYYENIQEIQEITLETKKVVCNFHIGKINLKEFTAWKNPTLVYVDLHKTGGDYQGLGFAVDNLENFKKSVNEIIEKYKIWTQ